MGGPLGRWRRNEKGEDEVKPNLRLMPGWPLHTHPSRSDLNKLPTQRACPIALLWSGFMHINRCIAAAGC